MPTQQHEMLIELFRNQPLLAAELLGGVCDIDLPPDPRAQLESADLTDCAPTEYRADAVVTLRGARERMAVIVEIQRGRDDGKRWSWPVYAATLRARLRCPTVLLVLCPDDALARWCAEPIDMGHPGWTLCPLAVGPGALPAVTDPEQAAGVPELAVLSAIAHGEARPQVLDALFAALVRLDDGRRAQLYADYVLAALPEAACKHLEELMAAGTYEYQSDFARRFLAEGRQEGRQEGRAEGEARSVVAVLDARGVAVSDQVRQRILGCTDLDVLDVWLRRALTVDNAEDLFAD